MLLRWWDCYKNANSFDEWRLFYTVITRKLAEKIWLENQHGGDLTQKKLEAMMIDYNLKYRKEKSYNDLVVAIGKGYKNSFGKSKVVREQLAGEIDKVLIRKRWDF